MSTQHTKEDFWTAESFYACRAVSRLFRVNPGDAPALKFGTSVNQAALKELSIFIKTTTLLQEIAWASLWGSSWENTKPR